MRNYRFFFKLLILITFGFITSTSAAQAKISIEDPIIEPINRPINNQACVVAGCSGQLCVDPNKDPIYSTCEWKEEYSCYQSSTCQRQDNGQCGWTQTPELTACLGGQPKPTPTMSDLPICGNHLCEAQEADESICPPPCSGTICPLMPCSFKAGICPQDCVNISPTQTPLPTTQPTCSPRPACLDSYPRCLPMEPINGWCPPHQPTPSPRLEPTRPSPTLSPAIPTPTPFIKPQPHFHFLNFLRHLRQSFPQFFNH